MLQAPSPPWIQFPQSEPTWSGWRQGVSEAWLLGVWLPFWRELEREQRSGYLETWPPPSREWAEQLAAWEMT